MLDVVIALVPALVAAVVFFGLRALTLVLVSVLSCVLFETLFNKIRKRKNTGRKEPEGTVFQSILGYLSWTLGIHGNDEYSIRYDCNLLLQICIT